MKRQAQLGCILAALAGAAPVLAQHDQHPQHSSNAGQESGDISSLSPQELEDLLGGAGMGLARPAELNHYPGPKHVLELAASLEVTQFQQAAVEAIHGEMLSEARRLGEAIVEKERLLDRRFAHRHLDEDTLSALTAEIATLYGRLRFVHLQAHLQTYEVLSATQVEEYDRLRGYTTAR